MGATEAASVVEQMVVIATAKILKLEYAKGSRQIRQTIQTPKRVILFRA